MRKFAIALLVWTFAAGSSALLAQTRIMPLGNSITQGVGSTNLNGYRKPLWNLLKTSFSVNFVGTLNNGDGSFDTDHEGHPRYRSDQVRQAIGGWLSQASPDMVLFHIGTNDISAGRTINEIITDIEATIDDIWNRKPGTRVFQCAIVPRKDSQGLNNKTQDLNREIESLVQRKRSQGPITFIDQYRPIANRANWETALMADNLHPNDSGYQIMAEVFYNTLQNFLPPVTPVELVTFNARAGSNGVDLQWETATETNNFGFFIEHAYEAGEFEEIGFVAGHGTTSTPHFYTYTHTTRQSGRHTYRLRQVDTDGTFEYSPEAEVEIGVPQTLALQQNYPNPFSPGRLHSQTTIGFELAHEEPVRLVIYDMLGREIARLQDGLMPAGSHTLRWDGRTLAGSLAASGIYFLRLETPTGLQQRPIQIVR